MTPIMLRSSIILSLAAGSLARVCQNITVPVSITSRNGVFNLEAPTTQIDVTDFFLQLSYQGVNYTEKILQDYATISNTYSLAATYCQPDAGPGKTLQILTHGIGFDRSYWDLSFNNYNYSYVVDAVDHGYSTFAWDRLGVGESSHGDPISEIQIFLEIAALAELTNKLSSGKIPGIDGSFDKTVHVGHSFGSAISYALVNMYPKISDAIILTGFSQVANFVPYFAVGGNFAPVSTIPALASKYPAGYVGPQTSIAVHTNFFAPGDFDPAALELAFSTGQPTTPGEVLTLGAGATNPNRFKGPVMIITGEQDIPYCGGNCYGTAAIDNCAPDLIENSAQYFRSASVFNATIVPGAGHGLNFGYSHVTTYSAMLNFLGKNV
ncbi:hypothetical protein S40285_08137 [Stachybotrys chlorohalonatus IBT 40285]|uniref:AB hydrolase-1 domain-containing protein n=1 Tax=Stachybotrys chlorohalonatus (strain IBT 40285) TaxID=1283841 RepID=A0A084QQ44_STAC4|nr:hypothetical protein S40285_08137 [Stachybotrys chlorohalonata IBT 40285]